MLDLKRLEETITDAMKETVSVIWLPELSVAVPGKTEICRKTWRKHCPIWLCTLFSSAKGFYTPYFFWLSLNIYVHSLLVVYRHQCLIYSWIVQWCYFDHLVLYFTTLGYARLILTTATIMFLQLWVSGVSFICFYQK